MARIVIGTALFFGRATASALVIPWTTYTAEVDRAVLDGETDCMVKVHADPKGRIFGATIVAARAGDLIGQVSRAMTNGLRLGQIARTIQPYPTQAEAIRKVGDVFNRSRLTPRVRSTMRLFLRLRR